MLDVIQLKIQSCSSSNFKIIEAIVLSIICSPLSGQFIELAYNEPVTQEELDLIPKNIPSNINITDYNDTRGRAKRIAADNSRLFRRLSEQT